MTKTHKPNVENYPYADILPIYLNVQQYVIEYMHVGFPMSTVRPLVQPNAQQNQA
jgi:hypothetical protein